MAQLNHTHAVDLGTDGAEYSIVGTNTEDTIDTTGGALGYNISAKDGNDTINGGDSNEVISGGNGNDTVNAGGGEDTINGGNGDDTLNGGNGDDTLRGNDGDDTINGDAGEDDVYGGEGADTLNGGLGDDTLYGDDGNDTLNGNDGDDTFSGGLGNDTINGGNGYDIAVLGILTTDITSYTFDGVRVTISSIYGIDQYSNIQEFHLTDGIFTISEFDAEFGENDLTDRNVAGDEVGNGIRGRLGNDNLSGGAGDDLILGDLGNDIINGDEGDDILSGNEGNDTINGGIGDDEIYGHEGDDKANGGSGDDEIEGGDGEDTLSGDAGNDMIDGGDDDDIINGNAGDDQLKGGDGDDEINGGEGDDTIDGQGGDDTLFGLDGSDVINGNAGDDRLEGNAGNDTLFGEDGEDTILGGSGRDIIYGGDDDDQIFGGLDNDEIYGDDGDDVISAGYGDDIVDGGDGIDRAVFTIDAVDIISYSNIDGTVTINSFDGNDRFTNIEVFQLSGSLYSLAELDEYFNPTETVEENDANEDESSDDNVDTTPLNASLPNAITNLDDYIDANLGDVIDALAGTDTVELDFASSSVIEANRSFNGVVTLTTEQGDITLVNVEKVSFLGEQTVDLPTFVDENLAGEVVYYFRDVGGNISKMTPEGYVGPVDFLQYQILGNEDSNIVTGAETNDFINLDDGDDAAYGQDGNDVLDGGKGSNFLIGGNGSDIFFLDGRNDGAITWSTITDFTDLDELNIWGWVEGISKLLSTDENGGATGFEGATFHYDLNNDGTIDTSVTFSGLSIDDLPEGIAASIADNGYLLFT